MTKKVFLGACAAAAIVYGGSLCWLSGFRSGYDEGETQAWTRARKAFVRPIVAWEPEETYTVDLRPQVQSVQ